MPSSKSWSPKSINHQSISFKIRFLFHPEKKCNPWELLFLLLLVSFLTCSMSQEVYSKSFKWFHQKYRSKSINWKNFRISYTTLNFRFQNCQKHHKLSQNDVFSCNYFSAWSKPSTYNYKIPFQFSILSQLKDLLRIYFG